MVTIPTNGPPVHPGMNAEMILVITGVSYRVDLVLFVNGEAFPVARSNHHGGVCPKAYRLARPDGSIVDVSLAHNAPDCSCPAGIFRRMKWDSLDCEHVQALRQWGLLPAPAHRSTGDLAANDPDVYADDFQEDGDGAQAPELANQ